MPILGPGSELAARAALATLIAAGPEAYAALHDGLMRLQGEITDAEPRRGADRARPRSGGDPRRDARPEVDRRLDETRALAETLAISGTPTFVFGDRMVRGYLPPEAMRSLVAEVRAAD